MNDGRPAILELQAALFFCTVCTVLKSQTQEGSEMAVQEKAWPVAAVNQKGEAAMESATFHYSPLVFLRTMFAIAWSAFRHPFSTTEIDLVTGKIVERAGEKGN